MRMRGVDAEQLQILDIGRHHPLEHRLEGQDLERERLALGVDADAVLDGAAGFVEKLPRLQSEACGPDLSRRTSAEHRPGRSAASETGAPRLLSNARSASGGSPEAFIGEFSKKLVVRL